MKFKSITRQLVSPNPKVVEVLADKIFHFLTLMYIPGLT